MANDKGKTFNTHARAASHKQSGVSRRSFLKTGAAAVGATAGAGAITGFPTIWAQEIKDIELRHVGVSYSVVKAIGDQAAKDLGFKVTMQNLDTSAAINRFIRCLPRENLTLLVGPRALLPRIFRVFTVQRLFLVVGLELAPHLLSPYTTRAVGLG